MPRKHPRIPQWFKDGTLIIMDYVIDVVCKVSKGHLFIEYFSLIIFLLWFCR